jgi:hypothetical protein
MTSIDAWARALEVAIADGADARPFLVGGAPRQPECAARADWSVVASRPRPDLCDMTDARRRALARRWTAAGRAAHASIAAAARFTLDLCALGAPADLVLAAQAAGADDARRAMTCFAMATAYGGAPVGPGALDVAGAVDARDATAIVTSVILESCVAETFAALEAFEAAERADDPCVKSILRATAADETRHAELGWRFVRWAIARFPEARAAAEATLASASSAATDARAAPDDADDDALAGDGVLPRRARSELRRRAAAGALRPIAAALFSRPSQAPAASEADTPHA